MCCRYYFDDIVMEDVMRLSDEPVDLSQHMMAYEGDIGPADQAVILSSGRGGKCSLCAEAMNWGFPSYNQLLINARAESALQKPTFSESVMRRRCIIPARHFYEWDRHKNKVTFSVVNQPVIYLAGFYNLIDNKKRFIVLTTAANASMERVHDRMPLILPEKQIYDWIFDDDMVRDILKQDSPMLKSEQEYEQLNMFNL